jgi:hypothetical protein
MMAFNPKHQTKVQYLRRLRERYRAAVKMDACRLANRILRHLADGDVTLVQMQTAWGMTAQEWAAKAVNLQARADKWLAFKAAENAASNEAGD